jgi:hypothetical protein
MRAYSSAAVSSSLIDLRRERREVVLVVRSRLLGELKSSPKTPWKHDLEPNP